MAAHEALHRDLLAAVAGKLPIVARPTGFGGSYNYGRMRNATAYIAGDNKSRLAARELWLSNEQEQLHDGHWTHRDQCEQGCPQPHLEFNLEPAFAVWLSANLRGDRQMAVAAQADVGRTLALARLFNLGGVVCMPGARAKQELGQWRQRPLDVLLAMVQGRRPIKYNGPAVTMFNKLSKLILGELDELSHIAPKLAFPIHYVRLSGRGYVAWIERSDEAVRRLLDPLTSVRFEFGMKKPELGYDWKQFPAGLVSDQDAQIIGV